MKPLQTKPQKKSFCSKLSTASLDFNGTDFNLEFESKNGKFQTKFGGYLTLILSLTVILTFILSASQLFSDNTPVVNTTPEFIADEITMKLYDEDLVMPLMFKAGNKVISSSEELSKYFTVKVFASKIDYNETIRRFYYKYNYELPLIPCSQIGPKHSRITSLVDKLFKNSNSTKKYLFCPDLGDKAEFYKLSTGEETLARALTRIRFYPCSLPDSSECASAAELDNMELSIYSNHKVLDASDYEDPIKYSPKKHKLKVDRSTRKILKYYFDANIIVDDSNQIRGGKTRPQFTTVELDGDNRSSRDPNLIYCSPEELAKGIFNRCNYVIDIQMIARKGLIKIRRSYKKASATLAEFGGYLKLILTLTFLFYSLVESRVMVRYLARRIWPHGGRGVPQPLQTSKQNNNKEEVFELVKTRTSVEDFQKNISLLDLLKNRYSLKVKESSQIGVLQKVSLNKMQLKEEPGFGQKEGVIVTKMKAPMPEGPTNYSTLSDAYNNIKVASLVSSSNIKKIINFYFLDLLKSDFEDE